MAVALADNYTLVLTDNHDVIQTHKVVIAANGRLALPVLMLKDKMFGGEHVIMVAANFGNCACVTKEGSVWAWGAALCRESGTEWPPVLISTSSAVPVSPYVTVTSSPAVMVTCYTDGIVFLTADGCARQRSLYDIFSNAQTIGVPTVDCYPSPWFNSIRIEMIASGKGHVMALGGGKLWTWAAQNIFDKSFYPLGRGNYQDSVELSEVLTSRGRQKAQAIMFCPGLVSPAAFQYQKIVFIAAGALFSIAVTEDGVLYSWGGAKTHLESQNSVLDSDELHVRNGYLGLGKTQSTNTPQRVGGSDFFDGAGVRQAACGTSHMLVLTDDNRIWSVGSDSDGQLGQQLGQDPMDWHDKKTCLVPLPLDMSHFKDKTIVLVAAGDLHSAAVTECGRMYVWGDTDTIQDGKCDFERLFRSDTSIPRRIPMSLFGGARVGLWNGYIRGHILALAMAAQARLGTHSSAAFTDDILYKIAQKFDFSVDAFGQGLRTLMGFRQA